MDAMEEKCMDKEKGLMVVNAKLCFTEEMKCFVGRQKEIKWIWKYLKIKRVCVVSGLGGVGKTLLARRFVQVYSERYGQCGWLHAEGATRAGIARALESWQVDKNTCPVLLVLDAAEGRVALRALLAMRAERRFALHVLVTAQSTDWGHTPRLQLEALRASCATTLVARAAGCSKRDAALVARILHGLPLALQQAAAYMREYRVNARDYLNALANTDELLEHRFAGGTALLPPSSEFSDYERPTTLTVAVCAQRVLSCEDKLPARLMYTLAYLAAGPVHKLLFAPLVQDADTDSAVRQRLDFALRVVARHSLVSVREHMYVQVHALAARALRMQVMRLQLERYVILPALSLITDDTKDATYWRPLLMHAHRRHLLHLFYRSQCDNKQALVFAIVRHRVWHALSTLLANTHEDPKLFGADAMLAAVLSGDAHAPGRLAELGVPLQAPGCAPPLLLAARRRDGSMAKALLALGAPVNERNALGDTALLVAARVGAMRVLQLLLAANADVNATNNHGECALREVVRRRDMPAVKLLLRYGAHVNAPNQSYDKQPLYWAVCAGDLQIARVLLAAGASVYWRGATSYPAGDVFVETRERGFLSLVRTTCKLQHLVPLELPRKYSATLTEFLLTNAIRI